METVRVEVTPMMSIFPRTPGFRNTLLLDIHQVIQEFIQDESGSTILVQSYMNPTSVSTRIRLKPRNFTPRYLFALLRNKLNADVSFCQFLAERIAFTRFSLANNSNHYQRPVLMKINVAFINELRFILPPVVFAPMNGASEDVFQRLIEEQRVESFDVDETCSICMENLSESSLENHENNIIQMPNCVHLFHQDCIFEWLSRHNSCPLCRSVPYEDDQY